MFLVEKKISLDQLIFECNSASKTFNPGLPTLASHLNAKLFSKRRVPASRMENQPGAKKKPKVVEAEPEQNQIDTQVQSSLRIIKNRENDAHDDERLSDLIALREQQMELEKVKSEPADEEDDNLPVSNFRSKVN